MSPIAWFARNHVAANLLMIIMLAGGVYFLTNTIPKEYFPESPPDSIEIRMSFRGATPSEVEEGVTTRIEEAIVGLKGIKEIRSISSEGSCSVNVQVERGMNARELLDDIKNRIDAINTFPEETERPVIALDTRSNRVITAVVAGDMNLRDLRRMGEQVRDEILAIPGITLASLQGVRPYEISIEVSQPELERRGIGIGDVANAVRRSSLDLPAGTIKTNAGEILLRTKGQAYGKQDFENIILRADPDGTRILVKDVATVQDTFDENPLYSVFNGKPCVFIQVDKTSEQNLLDMADLVRNYLDTAKSHMPVGVELSYWRDQSRPVRERLSNLTENMIQGGICVFIALALFLRLSLAFWGCTGIPIAFAGGIIVMHYAGFSINMFSLFGFIVVLGIVVDDAIVVGESVFSRWKTTDDNTEAAILGTRDVSTPVTFGVLTTITAFIPLLYLKSFRGNIFQQIPAVVVPVLLASLLETKFILPAHLSTIRRLSSDPKKINWFTRQQQRLADWLETTLNFKIYGRMLDVMLTHRYVALAGFASIFVVCVGLILGGHMKWNYWPKHYLDTVTVQLEMPLGTPAAETEKHLQRLIETGHQIREKYRDAKTGKSIVRNMMHVMGNNGSRGSISNSGSPNVAEVTLELPPYEERTIESGIITAEWRKLIGDIPGAKEIRFRDSYGGDDEPIDMQIAGQDREEIIAVSEQLQEKLKTYQHVFDVRDNFEYGKQEIRIRSVKPEAEAQGLTKEMVARQLRQAFYGEEAQRIQRGRDDVRVMVRFPAAERQSLNRLETMKLRTPQGPEIPFASAVEYEFGRSPTRINRVNRQRTIAVLADCDKEKADLQGIRDEFWEYCMRTKQQHPTLQFSWQGEARDQGETMSQLLINILFVLFGLYALMAIPFKSFSLPLIVLIVLPFGMLGSVLGHLVKGMTLSIFSVLGMLTLAGIIVNESLVLIDYVNQRRAEGVPLATAARAAGKARFRAIFLTNVTTFIGFAPLILAERTKESVLNQMSVSLAFGVIFSVFVALFLVPINYLILDDVLQWIRRGSKVSPTEADAEQKTATRTA
jgi:multidrug efflux pump subunit AcrB